MRRGGGWDLTFWNRCYSGMIVGYASSSVRGVGEALRFRGCVCGMSELVVVCCVVGVCGLVFAQLGFLHLCVLIFVF